MRRRRKPLIFACLLELASSGKRAGTSLSPDNAEYVTVTVGPGSMGESGIMCVFPQLATHDVAFSLDNLEPSSSAALAH
jgi:hypothetical protein